MKLEHCGKKFEGTVSRSKLGWHSVCPCCGSSFNVDLPNGKFAIVFADDDGENYVKNFTEQYTKANIKSYHTFKTKEEFITYWKDMYENPEGMWYWCLDFSHPEEYPDGYCFCSGACDPDDIEIFEEYFA